MALVTCPSCGGKISYRAVACPKCQYVPTDDDRADFKDAAAREAGVSSADLSQFGHYESARVRDEQSSQSAAHRAKKQAKKQQSQDVSLGVTLTGLALVFLLGMFLLISGCGFDQECRQCKNNVRIAYGNNGYAAPQSALSRCE